MKIQKSIDAGSEVGRVFPIGSLGSSSFSKYGVDLMRSATAVQDEWSRLFETASSDASVIPSYKEYSFPIHELISKTLRAPIRITLAPDDGGFIAQSIEFPLYGYGDTAAEAIYSLKSELESLYVDLTMDDEFTDDWLELKSSLLAKVAHG